VSGWTGAVRLFHVKYHGTQREAWVLSQTAEQAMNEVAGRDAIPYEGVLSASEVSPDQMFHFVCDDPTEHELVYADVPAWEEPVPRAGFAVTLLKTEQYKVAALARRWAEAYEATLEPFAFTFEPKLLGSR